MKYTLNNFITDTNQSEAGRMGHQSIRPRVFCKNGFSVSIQASLFAYCSPRKDFADKYTSFEMAYPHDRRGTITLDRTIFDDGHEDIYAFTDAEKIITLLDSWGGIDLELTIKNIRVGEKFEKLEKRLKMKEYINKL